MVASLSIYGEMFADESFVHKQPARGYFSMANAGLNTNGSSSSLELCPHPIWINQHVVFGRVIDGEGCIAKLLRVHSLGYGVVQKLEMVQTRKNNKPVAPCAIQDCRLHAQRSESS